MDIVEIEKDYLYAVKYDDQVFDEYNRIFEDFTNLELVNEFFETHKYKIGQYYVNELGYQRNETEAFSQYVINEAIELEEYFECLIDNTVECIKPDLKGHFTILEGFENEDMTALKSYGLNRPSMLRVYAIEVDDNCLIIFYSGIKIEHSLSDCPVLKENVIRKARNVLDFLKSNGLLDRECIREFAL